MRIETRPFQQESPASRIPEQQRLRRSAADVPSPVCGGQDSPEKISDEVVRAAAEAANMIAGMFGTAIEFVVHEETGFEILQIIDKRTNMVLREMPPHEILDMIARMWEAIGVFVDKTA